jgi:O-acetyl-ADP-ribose deacetylase (regulator of RNase III)
MRIISDIEVIRYVLGQKGRYAPYLGAGASIEADVKSAEAICEQIRDELVPGDLPKAKHAAWANDHLNWSDPSRRYVTCIRQRYPNEAIRVEYFRGLLRDKQPSFCHHAVALLMGRGWLRNTCLTSNFDHLLESAFTRQGNSEWQAIRSEYECPFWQDRNDRYYILKLHGDIDTENILNTRDETIRIGEGMQTIVETVVRGGGLLVLGTSGNEKSIRGLFDHLRPGTRGVNTPLSLGLFWGVYMDSPRPKRLDEEKLRRQVERRIEETEINRDIVDMMEDVKNELFCFFPVWGAGEFMFDLVQATPDDTLRSIASRSLDHDMRLRAVFGRAGLSEEAIKKHLKSLHDQRSAVDGRKRSAQEEELVSTTSLPGSGARLRVVYGDITSTKILGTDGLTAARRAVVSPEDTCISAGGGVAYQLLEEAGPDVILIELAKFSPVPQRSVAVTSGGNLPVHYIFHAAALQIEEDAAYSVSPDDVEAAVADILRKASVLEIDALWIPLIGAGVASLEPLQSFEAILRGLADWDRGPEEDQIPLTVTVVIYRERDLPRHEAAESLDATFPTARVGT